MAKIYFRNTKEWKKIKATFGSKTTNVKATVELNEANADGLFEVDFDSQSFDYLYFSGGIGKRTGKVYPGNLSIGVDCKYNENKREDLTYLYSPNSKIAGRIENYTLTDEENLSYRSDKSKKISVFLPSDYSESESYDLLYFFDAQNLFCNSGKYTKNGDPYGSWQLDLVLDEIYRQYGKKIIVVGIDNADEYRSHELFMDPDTFGKLSPMAKAIPDDDFSKGYLDNLSDFMTSTLHTFISSRYSINNDNIGIGGSSMGGIAAFYCGIKQMGFYKYVLSYSPAFGLYDMSAFDSYFSRKEFGANQSLLPKIHIYCGGGDMLERMLLPSAKKMKKLLTSHGYPDSAIFETYDNKKPHNEETWRLILPESLTFFFDL